MGFPGRAWEPVGFDLFRWMLSILIGLWLIASNGRGADLVSNHGPQEPGAKGLRSSLRVERNVVFHQVDGQSVLADLYRPNHHEILPIIVMIHGGAWIAGDKWNVIDHAAQMAEAGFVVMAINYRLAPRYRWPAQQVDCQAALEWVAQHHSEWHADKHRIGVWGYSAGGHLGLMLALDQSPGLPRVQACVAGGPPCDLQTIAPDSRMLFAFLGGTRAEIPERYRDASPITRVSSDDPPVFLFHGDQDGIVPFDNSQRMYEALVQKGVACEFHKVEELGHLMTFLDRDSRSAAIEFFKIHLAQAKP